MAAIICCYDVKDVFDSLPNLCCNFNCYLSSLTLNLNFVINNLNHEAICNKF